MAAAATDMVGLHNKAQFLSLLFEGLATAKQLPASLRQHLAFGRSTCKHFLKPHFRMQKIAQQKLPLEKGFDAPAYAQVIENLRQVPEAKNSATLMGAVGKLEEAVKGTRQPTLQETVEAVLALSKEMALPQTVLKPTIAALVASGVFDSGEVDEVTNKVAANPFNPEQVWDAVADRIDASKDGRVATYRKMGKTPPVQGTGIKVGHFQIVDLPKDKQFAMMPITPGLANAMACGPQRANFTHLDSCDHPAARGLLEDLTNILLIGTNVAGEDRDKSVAVTLRSIAQDPMAVSFRTIIDKSVAQGAPTGKSLAKQPAGVDTKKSAPSAPAAPAAGGETNVMAIFEQLKQMGQGVNVQIEMLDAVFAQLVAGNVCQQDEVDRAKTDLKTKADDKGQVSFPVIQEVFMQVFGSKFGPPK